jgi:hypothetical protein
MASRFKRIPFTTPGARASRDEVRESYERGCGEALSCLRSLLDEIGEQAPRLAPKAPGGGASTPGPLQLERVPKPESNPIVAQGVPKVTVARKPGIRIVETPSGAIEPSELDLREARTLPHAETPTHDPAEEVPAPRATARPRPPERTERRDPVFRAIDPQDEPEEEPLEEPAEEPVEEPSGVHEVARRAMADYLDSSPVFAAMARMEHPKGVEPRLSPSALALAALASELADLGVPPPQRGEVSGALNGLAKHIDRRDLTWTELREAVGVVMEFRGVARRMLPLLLPFLDEAA